MSNLVSYVLSKFSIFLLSKLLRVRYKGATFFFFLFVCFFQISLKEFNTRYAKAEGE